MNKKFSKLLSTVLTALVIALALCLACCGKGDSKQGKTFYAVTLVVDGEGGDAQADKQIVEKGESVTFAFVPDEHYSVSELILNGQKVEHTGNTYVLKNANSDINVTVSFAPILYKISVDESMENGSILLDETEAPYGEKVGFSVLPDRGYLVETVYVGETEYTAENCPEEIEITSDITLSATFTAAQEVTVEKPALFGGNEIAVTYLDGSVPEDGKFYLGERVLISLSVASDYRIKWVKVNGEEVSLNSVNAFSLELTQNVALEAEIVQVLHVYFYDGQKQVGEYEFLSGDGVKEVEVSLPGYHVVSWHEKSDLSDAAFDFSLERTKDVNLFVKKEANEYQITFHSNDENGQTVSQNHIYDTEKTLSENGFEREEWFFMGWSTTTDGDVEYQDAQAVKNLTVEENGNVDLYAVWGGVSLPDSYDVEKGESAPLAFTPVHLDTTNLTVVWSVETNEKCTLSDANQIEATVSGIAYGLQNKVTVSVTYQGKTIERSTVLNVWEKGAKYYVLVSSAAELKAVDFTKYNVRLTANIDLGADISSQLIATNLSASYDGTASAKPLALIAKIDKHLDGNGYKLTYGYRGWWGCEYALIGILTGKVSNLMIDATVRMAASTAAFIGHAWDSAVIENCYIKITTATDDGTDGQQGTFLRYGGLIKNTVFNVNVRTATNKSMNAIAYGPALNTTSSFFEATFENVVVLTNENQPVYSMIKTLEDVAIYHAETDLFAHDFTGWDETLWKFETDGDGNVTGMEFGNENELPPEEEVEWTAISSVEEFKALEGKDGYYYLTKDLAFTLAADSVLANGQAAVVNTFNGVLDGKGHTITYTGTENAQWYQGFFYYMNGKVCNLNFVANVKISPYSSAFACVLGEGSEISNCYFDITTTNNSAAVDSTYENTLGIVCQSVRETAKIKNVIVKAVAYKSDGVTENTVIKAFAKNAPAGTGAQFEDVVVIVSSALDMTGAETEPVGISRYATLAVAYSQHDFSTWDKDVWNVENEGTTVIGVSLKKI